MRVTSGLLKNRTLTSPKDSSVRPTSDKVRGAIFSSLGEIVEQARFLDLFAGSGAVGIEAYSRGARHVTFAELFPNNLNVNVKLLPQEAYTILTGDLFKLKFHTQYDIIFIDPPYGKYFCKEVLEWLQTQKILAENGVVVYEDAARVPINADELVYTLAKERKYGDTMIRYFTVC